jgi:hypothetical protein
MQHALHRTSPKGGPFIGTCANCGTPNLTLSQSREECPNQRGMTQEETLLEAIREDSRIDWPDPTPEMQASPEFEKVWQCIKRWDINVPGAYVGYSGATGNHVRAILDALKSE